MEEHNTEYARQRAIAIKQYRFLSRIAREARAQRNYYLFTKYSSEAQQLRYRFNL